MHQCAARGCKRKVWCPRYGNQQNHLCYKHGWWYAACHQAEYTGSCTILFPVWTAGDIAVWLEWCGI